MFNQITDISSTQQPSINSSTNKVNDTAKSASFDAMLSMAKGTNIAPDSAQIKVTESENMPIIQTDKCAQQPLC